MTLFTATATASGGDINLLFVILALAFFAGALYVGLARHEWFGALVLAIIGVLIVIFAVV